MLNGYKKQIFQDQQTEAWRLGFQSGIRVTWERAAKVQAVVYPSVVKKISTISGSMIHSVIHGLKKQISVGLQEFRPSDSRLGTRDTSVQVEEAIIKRISGNMILPPIPGHG